MTAHQLLNCSAAFGFLVNWDSSTKEGSVWFSHGARRPEGEWVRGLILPTPLQTCHKRVGSQVKLFATAFKEDQNRYLVRETSVVQDGRKIG